MKMAEVIWEPAEPCPAEYRGRHANVGDYDLVVRVEWYSWALYRVVFTDDREPFPGDRGGYCERCGFRWQKDATQHWCGLLRGEAFDLAFSIAQERQLPLIVR
jgi:hypothetical protein